MHLLQLCPRVPFPLHDGGAIAMYELTRGLAQAGHRVTVLAANTPKHHQPADALAHLGPNVRLVTVDVDTTASPLKALKNLLASDLPYTIERFNSLALAEKLKQLIATEAVDLVQIEGTQVSWYAGWLRQHVAPEQLPPLVLRAHNLEYRIWELLARGERNPLTKWYLGKLAKRLKAFEQWQLPHYDALAAITEADAARLRALGQPGGPVTFIPAGVDLSRFQPSSQPVPYPPSPAQPQPKTLFMIGSLNWLPNQEGLAWLLREVWPAVHAELPDLTLHVAGYGAPADLLAAPPAGVVMHGFVESAPDFMRQHALMLVPLLSGGGMRVKIIEGLALGKVILSTSLGAEGIAVHDGRDILLRDAPADWLAAIRAWHRGELDTAAIGAAATRTATSIYDNRQVVRRFEDLYAHLARAAPAAASPAPER
ncbi:glycosyltransferase family 4 protein [uncultured Hymenobacter sp.]|uniref:glycosyltransferase family 4 protein n=1 Tax=uncultured Hymenobacter sp. TaxID=170016 RepID=UPI0035CAC289